MAIEFNDNILVKANKPSESKYLNISQPWVSISEANANIPQSYRHSGLTVNIMGVEYWYASGVADVDLVIKSAGAGLASVENGLHISSGTTISLGGTLTGTTVFDGGSGDYVLEYNGNYHGSYTNRSLVDKEYVDDAAAGVRPKQAVKVATTVEVVLSGLTTVDGYSLQDGDRVLVKDQTDPADNGVYVATGTTWSRSDDFDGTPSGEVVSGVYMYVLSGDTNKDYAIILTTEDPITIGVSELTFVILNAPQTVSRGVGISILKTGNDSKISVDGDALAGTYILWESDTFKLDATAQIVVGYALTGATNGITKTADRLAVLGGTLTGTTMITQPYSAISTFTIGNGDSVNWYGGRLSTTRDNVSLSGNSALIGARGDSNNYSSITLPATSGMSFSSSIGGTSRNLRLGLNGMIYGDCYHSCYTDRSLVDKEYVDNISGSIDGINGLHRDGDNISFGGELTGNTYIYCTYDLYLGDNDYPLDTLYTIANSIDMHTPQKIEKFSASTYTDLNSTPSGLTYTDCYHSTYVDRSLVDKEYVDNCFACGTEITFNSDIEVSLTTGKSFGRYCNGDTIPASGKTPSEVILMSVVEPIPPTINLSSHSNVVTFGESSKVVNVDMSYVINSLNGSVSSVLLEYRRGGSWISLTTDTGATGYLHNIDDSLDRFNDTLIEYKYTVIDSLGGSGYITHNVTPEAYTAPTISPTYVGTILGYETQPLREVGNINSTIGGSIASNMSLVDLRAYRVYRSVDSGGYVLVTNESGFTTQNKTITSYLDSGAATTALTIDYKVEVDDEYTGTTSSIYSIDYRYASYFGYSSNKPLTAGQILSLGNQELLTTPEREVCNVSAGSTEYTYYTYPAAWGDLTNIVLEGVTPVLGAFSQLSDVIVRNNYGQTVNNVVYASNATYAFTNNSLCFS